MTYDVLLIKKNEKFVARVRQWPEIVVEEESEEKALAQARADLEALLLEARVVQLDIDVESAQHPWSNFVGMFSNDADWDAFQAEMQQYRQEIDQAWAEV